MSAAVAQPRRAVAIASRMFPRPRTEWASVDATISVPRHDFTVTAKAEGVAGESNGDGKIDLTIRSGADEIVVDAETIEGQIDATFTVNGELFATATGDATSPTIRGEGGRELTAEEFHALGAVIRMAEGLFALVGSLLAPAGVLLLLALGLS